MRIDHPVVLTTVPLSKKERARVETILRRMAFLKERIKTHPTPWDHAEYASLHWLLEQAGLIEKVETAAAE